MRLLVIGGRGMAGHVLNRYLKQTTGWEVWHTVRGTATEQSGLPLDVRDESALSAVLAKLRPDIVINAAGLLNEDAARKPIEAIEVNSLLPHRLARYGGQWGFKLIHISTDCVFSGKRGLYSETDPADGISVYAMTKSLGEVGESPHLTVRTSIIGPELKPDGIGLFHWFMRQTGVVSGYRQAFWSGVTTLELAKAAVWLIGKDISGLVHLAGERISKYDLLLTMKEVFALQEVMVIPEDGIRSDKSLLNTRSDMGYPVPSHKEMLSELKEWMAAFPVEYSQYAGRIVFKR